MKHLLLVCYYYPPDGGGGTQRPLSIARHAAACGWRVTVLTRGSGHHRGDWDPEDPTLVDDFEHVQEVRVPELEGSLAGEMIAPTEAHTDPWLEALTTEAVRLNQHDRFDHALITMPPYGMSPLAHMLKKACPDLPVSIDLRDPWAFDGAYAYPSKAQWKQNHAAMRRTLHEADSVVLNTWEVRKRVIDSFPGIDPSRLTVVTNGFEPDLFTATKPAQPEGHNENLIHLVHTGTLHSKAALRLRGPIGWLRQFKNYRAEPARLSGRTALPLLKAMVQLKQSKHAGFERLRLVLVGLDDTATRQIVDKSGLAEQVLLTGYMPHDEAVAWLRWAQCLFLPLHGLPDGHRSLIIPGKTYEYLASERPILGALPQGDARRLVEDSGRAFTADPCDVSGLAKQLGRVIDASIQNELPKGQSAAWAQQFSRLALTRQLFSFLDQVVDRSSR